MTPSSRGDSRVCIYRSSDTAYEALFYICSTPMECCGASIDLNDHCVDPQQHPLFLLGTGEGQTSLSLLPPALFLFVYRAFQEDEFCLYSIDSFHPQTMPHSNPDHQSMSSGKSPTGSGQQHGTAAQTTHNVGYVSHRQAWAERKKKTSGDKVS